MTTSSRWLPFFSVTVLLILLILHEQVAAERKHPGVWGGFQDWISRQGSCGDGQCSSASLESCQTCAQDCCPNDECNTAQAVNFTQSGEILESPTYLRSFVGASNSSFPGLGDCYSQYPDLWFLIRPPVSGLLNVSTCHPGSTDLIIASLVGTTTASNPCTEPFAIRCLFGPSCSPAPFSMSWQFQVFSGFTYLVLTTSLLTFPGSYMNIGFSLTPFAGATPPVCGDTFCSVYETCSGCPADCCPNNQCSTPLEVIFPQGSSSVSQQGSIVGATKGSETPTSKCHAVGPEVWFYYQPTVRGLLAVNTCSENTTFDTVLAVFQLGTNIPTSPGPTASPSTGSTTFGPLGTSGAEVETSGVLTTTKSNVDCSSLSEVRCNDDGGSGCVLGSRLTAIVEPEKQYLIRLSSRYGTGHYQANFQFTPLNLTAICGDHRCTLPVEDCRFCPQDCCPNDNCTSPTPVTISGSEVQTFLGDTTNATADITPPDSANNTIQRCTQSINDVWFELSVSSDQPVNISLCSPITNFDSVLDVFVRVSNAPPSDSSVLVSSQCGDLSLVACNDDANPMCPSNHAASSLVLNAKASERYLVRVGGYVEEGVGNFEITFGPVTLTQGAPATGPSASPNPQPPPGEEPLWK